MNTAALNVITPKLDIKIRPDACCPKCGCSISVEEELCEG